MDYMTITELSKALGVSKGLIGKRIKELFPDLMKKGIRTKLSDNQVTAISLRIKQNSSLATSHDRKRLSDMPKTDLEKKLIVKQAIDILNNEVDLLKEKNEQLQIELDEHKAWYSVKRVQLMGYLKDRNSRELWSPLKKYSIANDYQIKSIFDSNYGEVKSYHREVWEAVYNILLKDGK